MAKVVDLKEKNVVDGEIVTQEAAEATAPRCELVVGVGAAGNIYMRIGGEDQSLVLIEGLLRYAHIEVERLWASAFKKEE